MVFEPYLQKEVACRPLRDLSERQSEALWCRPLHWPQHYTLQLGELSRSRASLPKLPGGEVFGNACHDSLCQHLLQAVRAAVQRRHFSRQYAGQTYFVVCSCRWPSLDSLGMAGSISGFVLVDGSPALLMP